MEKALKSARSTRAAEAREGIGRGARASGFTSVQWAQSRNSHGGWPGGSPREAASVQHQEHSTDRHDSSSLSRPPSHARLSLQPRSVAFVPWKECVRQASRCSGWSGRRVWWGQTASQSGSSWVLGLEADSG